MSRLHHHAQHIAITYAHMKIRFASMHRRRHICMYICIRPASTCFVDFHWHLIDYRHGRRDVAHMQRLHSMLQCGASRWNMLNQSLTAYVHVSTGVSSHTEADSSSQVERICKLQYHLNHRQASVLVARYLSCRNLTAWDDLEMLHDQCHLLL